MSTANVFVRWLLLLPLCVLPSSLTSPSLSFLLFPRRPFLEVSLLRLHWWIKNKWEGKHSMRNRLLLNELHGGLCVNRETSAHSVSTFIKSSLLSFLLLFHLSFSISLPSTLWGRVHTNVDKCRNALCHFVKVQCSDCNKKATETKLNACRHTGGFNVSNTQGN